MKSTPYQKWSEREDSLLRVGYLSMSQKELRNLLNNRSWNAIKCRVRVLKLKGRKLKSQLDKIKINLTNEQAAYLAGIIDGEGSISLVYPHHKWFEPRISIYNNNMEVLETIQKWVPGALIHPKYKKLEIKGIIRIFKLLNRIKKFLIIKRKHAELMIKFCRIRLEAPTNSPYKRLDEILEIRRQILKLNYHGK